MLRRGNSGEREAYARRRGDWAIIMHGVSAVRCPNDVNSHRNRDSKHGYGTKRLKTKILSLAKEHS